MNVRTRTGVALVALGLLASSCAGRTASLDQPESTTAQATNTASTTGQVETTGSGATTSSPPTIDTDELVYQIESDTLGGWMPHTAAAAISGHLVLRSVFDLLAYPDTDGRVQPLLLSAIEPNADATEWTLTTRPGITFHDGTGFDATAVAANIERHRTSPITAPFVADIVALDVVAEDRLVVVLAGPRPHFASRLTTLLGYMASPTWLDAVEAGSASPTEPIGTGPFVFAAYEPGQFFEATANPDYWRPGEPTIDSIRFEMNPNGRERISNVIDRAVAAAHTDSADEILRSRDLLGSSVGMVEAAANGETSYLMLNQADPNSPMADLDVRRALSLGIDRDRWRAARAADFFETANGPFPPGSMGHLDDTGIPGYDLDEARRLIDEYEADNGPLVVLLSISDRPTNLISADLLTQMWADIGVDTTVSVHPQSELIGLALTGQFQILLWRNHGSYDPSLEAHWWSSQTAGPVGEPALNLSRIQDDVIDQQLAVIVGSPDPEVRRSAAEALNRRFGEQVYNIWLTWPVWAVVHNPGVHLEGAELPSGDRAMPLGVGIGGAHLLSHLWLEVQ